MKSEDLKGLNKVQLKDLRSEINGKIHAARKGKKSDKALLADKALVLAELESRQGG